jgi:hypothetical protein
LYVLNLNIFFKVGLTRFAQAIDALCPGNDILKEFPLACKFFERKVPICRTSWPQSVRLGVRDDEIGLIHFKYVTFVHVSQILPSQVKYSALPMKLGTDNRVVNANVRHSNLSIL